MILEIGISNYWVLQLELGLTYVGLKKGVDADKKRIISEAEAEGGKNQKRTS